jgi:hypothetical protein
LSTSTTLACSTHQHHMTGGVERDIPEVKT